MRITVKDAGLLMQIVEKVLDAAGAVAERDELGREILPVVTAMPKDELVMRLIVDEAISFDEADPIANDVGLGMWITSLVTTRARLPNGVGYSIFPIRAQYLGGSDDITMFWLPALPTKTKK